MARVAKYVRLARERQRRDLARQRTPEFPYYYDQVAADKAVRFFPTLVHWKGDFAGQRFYLQDWQAKDVIGPVFGWKRLDGRRRFRTAYMEIPRKNGKTTTAAGVGLRLGVADQEAGSEIYSAATKRDQAMIVFKDAKYMAEASPALKKYVDPSKYSLEFPHLKGFFQPLGADSDTLDGLNASGVILDETHAMKSRHLYDVLRTSMGSRSQALMFVITTAGEYRPTSIGWELHQTAQKVLEQVWDDESFFGYICSAEKDKDDWRDPEVWKMANPNYGVSVRPDYLEEVAREAARSPEFLKKFMMYHLNIWPDAAATLIASEDWRACGDFFDENDLAGRVCYGGLDLASKIDLTAFALCFPPDQEKNDGLWHWILRFWLPEKRFDYLRVSKSDIPFSRWVDEDWISVTPGASVDYSFIRKEIKELGEIFKIQEIGFDPWNATETAQILEEEKFQMIEVRQGPRTLSEPMQTILALVADRRLRHGGNPPLQWNASNVVARYDANKNMAPDRKKSTGKIDGFVAGLIAQSRAMFHDLPESSVYNERGLRTLG